MEIIQIAEAIETRIKALDEGIKELRQAAENKAFSIAEYDKRIAVTIIKLKHGEIYNIDGYEVTGKGIPANLVEKIAKGICQDARLEAEKAEAIYKACVVNIQATEASLNGLQTLNRHLRELTENK